MNTVPAMEQIISMIQEASSQYYRLVLVVGPAGSGKSQILREISSLTNAPILNISLDLSKRMLDLTTRQRILQTPRLLEELLRETGNNVVLLDNTELLFDATLKLDPLRLLQGVSRNRTIIAAWNGAIEGDKLTYAMPEHPEYRRYPLQGLLIARLEHRS